jgi:amino acid adenylation domain-containing protein
VQVISKGQGIALPMIDLQGLAGHEEADRLAAAEARRPFDLGRGPLLRAVLLKSAAGRHTLLLTMHHIVSDGWSMGVLVRELGALYATFLTGRPSPLPEPAIQYADFAAWQRSHLTGDVLDAELAWWRGQLAGLPAALELPVDRPRPAVRSGRGAVHGFTIDPDALAGLQRLARQHGATLFMALLAGFAALLERYAGGQDDLAVGTPVAGRTRIETEPLIGFFVNTLVLRLDLAGDPRLADLLARVRETTLSAYAHQEVPFERLVEELAPERDLSRPPLVQVMFSLQNAPAASLELPGIALTAAAVPTGTAKLELSLDLEETAGGLAATIEYDRDLFERATIERLAGQTTRLLAGAMAFPHKHLSELPLLSGIELQQLLVEWNDADSAFPREAGLPELFAGVARERPDAPAVVDEAETWSYRRLDEASNHLAGRLRELGVAPQEPVGLCLERSAEAVVAILAILKAGGVYIPLDPAYPEERLRFMLADTGARVVLVHAATRAQVAALDDGCLLIEVNNPDELGEPSSFTSFQSFSAPTSLAYVIYTSGSTGRPKGVAVPHRGVVRLVQATNYLQIGPRDRVAFLSSISFDAATFEIWGALLNGAALIVVPQETVLSPVAMVRALGRQGVTVLHLTTALFNQVAREAPESLAALGAVLFGGEASDPAAARAVLAAGPPRRLLHVYGPTESTTYATWQRLDEVPPGAQTLSIGMPLASTSIWVLDRRRSPVPLGAAGELAIGGEGLAWGYWNRPELTAERFVPHPWENGGRLYRTGDLVRRRMDGAIEFLGRFDHQVKIRGFRIEPGEIETVLLQHPAVREAAVIVLGRGSDDRRLAAFVTGDGLPPMPPVIELRRWLQARLPAYMVPSSFTALAALPLTPSLKVDRRALEARGEEHAVAAPGRAPRTPAEELVAGIFAGLLQREPVDAESHFFELGGHSLLATQVASRVRAVFGIELPVRAVFEAPTVEGLAAWIERSAGESTRDVAIEKVARDEPPPLSFAQQRLWFLDQLEPGSPLYNVPAAVELAGRLDVPVLAAALAEVVRRHEALRTTFAAAGGRPVQVISREAGFVLPVADLQGLPAAARRPEAERLAQAEARQPFDLQQGPLLRTVLLKSAAESHTVLLTMHHIVSDGWSIGVLVRELGALYPAFLAGRPSPLPELAVQYADFAAWQRGHLSGALLESELAWWRERLAGMPAALDLPADRPRPAVRSLRGAARSFAIDREGLAGLTALARQHGATLFMTLLAGFLGLLRRSTGEGDLAVGSPVAGRTRIETEPLIGFFVNTLVLRADLAGDPDVGELLRRVRETTLSAWAHQELPFERLVEELAPERDASRPPLVQVLFALQNAPAAPLELPGLSLAASELPTETAKVDLTCTLVETEAGLAGTIESSRDLFEAPTISRLAGHLGRLLAGAVEDPRRPLSELPLLSKAERQQLFVEANDTASAWPREASLPELFAAVAAEHADAPAIVSGDEVWSYRRLDQASNHLALHLRQLGVRLEDAVGLAMERSPELIVGTLAILKAGGVYVPLDASYPDERLRFMLADTGAQVVLVHESTRERLAALDDGCALVDVSEPASSPLQSLPTLPSLGGAALAYIIYTSGSTGRPKGVAVPHRAIVRLVRETNFVRLGPGDRTGHVANISFDAATYEIWGALLNGGAVVVIPREAVLSPSAFAAALHTQRVTTMFLTSALFTRMSQEAPDAFAGMSELLVGGEAVDPVAARTVLAGRPPRRLLNGYGPTETTTFASWHPIREVPPGAASIPVGRPLGNTSLWVLDRWLAPVPPGAPGELCIGGDGLARGYHNREDLTAERFVPNPWRDGERLYRTGDLARQLPDGTVDLLGRLDDQVKIRGFRIEPGEIEALLLAHPDVRACAVVARRNDRDHEVRLTAYVVGHDGQPPRTGELRAWLQERVPDYMLPGAFVILKALPLTANGKLDRQALPAPERALEETGRQAASADPVEELLAGIFAEVLGLPRVGPQDDFRPRRTFAGGDPGGVTDPSGTRPRAATAGPVRLPPDR